MLTGHVVLCDLFLTEENTIHPEKLSFFENYGNCSVIRKTCIRVVSCLFVVVLLFEFVRYVSHINSKQSRFVGYPWNSSFKLSDKFYFKIRGSCNKNIIL